MIPGMNSRQMKQMMRQMGMQQVDVEAVRVVIETPEKNIVFDNLRSRKVNMMGQDTWQLTGNFHEEAKDTSAEISDEDVNTVVEQTGVSLKLQKKRLNPATATWPKRS